MRSVYTIYRMMARRSLANWRLTAVLALGILVAATLLAAAPIYARAMADLGLTFALRDRLRTEAATQVQVRDVPLGAEDGRRLQAAVEQRTDERLGWFTAKRDRFVEGPRFQASPAGEAATARSPTLVTQFFGSAESNVRVVDGRLPRPAEGNGGAVIEVALSPRAAEAGGLTVGQRLTLTDYYDDCEREIPREDRPPPPPCTPKVGLSRTLPALVVGLIEPADPEGLFWAAPPGRFFDPTAPIPLAGPWLPVLIDEQALYTAVAGMVPEYRANITWQVVADRDKLSRANYRRARTDILDLREDLRLVDGFAFSALEGVFSEFDRDLRFQQAPLLILLLQISGIALFYVAVIATIVVEQQAGEIALLRSRGAGWLQVGGVSLLEGLTLAVPVVLIAPLLAGLMTALLGLTPALDRVTGGELLPARIGPTAFALAALGALLSLAMLLGPALMAARLTGVSVRRQAARPVQPLFTRYYLDLAVVALAALLLWELNERGSVFTPSAAGGVSSDPLLLVSPAVVTLGAAALVLRFYPLVLRALSAVSSPATGVPVTLGLWQVVRNPGQYTRLALLLMMSVAVGTFAASYSSTAERSFRDRASFESGADLRLTVGEYTRDVRALQDGLRGTPGVELAAAVVRSQAGVATPGGGQRDMVLLGLDPELTPELLWFRDDLAGESLTELMAKLRGPAPRGRPLPGTPAAVSLWVNPSEARENVTMWVRLRDSTGGTSMFELGKIDFTGWRQLRAPLAAPYAAPLVPPIAVVSVVFSEPSNVNITRQAPVYIDDLAAEGPEGTTVVEDFEGTLTWQAAPARTPTRGGSLQDDFVISSEQRRGGLSSGRFAFRPGTSTGLRGIFVSDPALPLPIIVSPEFINLTGASVGTQTLIVSGDNLIPVVVRGVAGLFPTVAGGATFVLANRDQLLGWWGTFSDSTTIRPNEAWLRLDPANREQARTAVLVSPYRLGPLSDREQVLASVNANPLVAAGGSGILWAAFLGVLTLVGVALLVTLVASVKRRRTELAVMRAMGVSRGQVFRLLAFEYSLVAVLGIAGGVFLGLQIGTRMLSFLSVTENGATVVPPFVLQTDWPAVLLALAAVVIADRKSVV